MCTKLAPGGVFPELIQPVSGQRIFQDFPNENPAGGVHHIAHPLPGSRFDQVVAHIVGQGCEVVAHYNTPEAKIVIFDAQKEIGVFTEIIELTGKGRRRSGEL